MFGKYINYNYFWGVVINDNIMKRVVIYARVSSSNGTQDYQRQINDLTVFASQNNYEVVKVLAEMVSGAKINTERLALMELIEFVNTNDIDKVLVTELSRLGRDTLQTLQTIELLNQNRISLYIWKIQC